MRHVPTVTSDAHGRSVEVAQLVPHGRARTTGEIVALLACARIVLDAGTVEAALIMCPSVEQVAPGVWRRRDPEGARTGDAQQPDPGGLRPRQ